jgi:hypothetical protein
MSAGVLTPQGRLLETPCPGCGSLGSLRINAIEDPGSPDGQGSKVECGSCRLAGPDAIVRRREGAEDRDTCAVRLFQKAFRTPNVSAQYMRAVNDFVRRGVPVAYPVPASPPGGCLRWLPFPGLSYYWGGDIPRGLGGLPEDDATFVFVNGPVAGTHECTRFYTGRIDYTQGVLELLVEDEENADFRNVLELQLDGTEGCVDNLSWCSFIRIAQNA